MANNALIPLAPFLLAGFEDFLTMADNAPIALAPFLLGGFVLLLLFLIVVGAFILVALRTIFGGGKKNPQMDAEEARLMQDLNHSFQKLEQRVESLETIMLENGTPRPDARAAGKSSQ